MISKNLNFKNNLKLIKVEKKLEKKLSKNFLKTIFRLKKDLRNNKKTLNVLDRNFSFNFQISKLKKFKNLKQ